MSELSVAGPPVFLTRARARIDRLNGAQRLVIFSACLGLIGAALWLGPLRDVQRMSTTAAIPWWAELLTCYLTSLLFVQVRVHREVSTLSLTEIPVALGLFLIDPHQLLACYVVGVLLASWTRRRVLWVKDFANAMLDVLYIGVAVLVFNAVGPNAHDPLAARSILAFAAAMVAAGWFVYPVALNVGTSLAQARLRMGDIVRAYLFQVAASTTNACLGIVALVILTTRPVLAFALLPPVLLVLAGQIAATEKSATSGSQRVPVPHHRDPPFEPPGGRARGGAPQRDHADVRRRARRARGHPRAAWPGGALHLDR